MTPLPPAYFGLEPAAVWQHFGALNQIPRPSGQEDAARAYVQHMAQNHGATWQTDARGNLVVRVAAREARGDAPIVTLQSHLDMVCQKRPDVAHDFNLDPIVPRRDGDKIFALGTTLGADNGIGAAMMLAILTNPPTRHGPLELLFTVEEETGLFGAAHLDGQLVRGRLLVNLDSEEGDEITVGCAGGATTNLFLPVARVAVTPNFVTSRINVGGLQGGHSGVQIGGNLGNAIKILGQILSATSENCDLRLIGIDGGTAHNAIPRDAWAEVSVPAEQKEASQAAFAHVAHEIKARWRAFEPDLHLEHEQSALPDNSSPLSLADTTKVLGLLRDLPHGVAKMSARFEGKVQTSSNLAEVHGGPESEEVAFSVSNRSFVADELQEMQQKVADLGRAAGARVEARDGYPGWEPRGDSPLLQTAMRAFESVMGKAPHIEVVHAGLECGLLCEKLLDLDAVSFGPLIRGAHTPEEWVSIPSTAENFAVLNTLLEELA
ncbi:MAG: beta-Ala-His dipeptidase [Armatimonadetes bacterium]|nr:beta-Ala-His dipeptidase [Armatimonadota bacterium]